MTNIRDTAPRGYGVMDFFQNRVAAGFAVLFIVILCCIVLLIFELLDCIGWFLHKIPYWVGWIVNWTKEMFFDFLVLLLCWSLSNPTDKDRDVEAGEEGL